MGATEVFAMIQTISIVLAIVLAMTKLKDRGEDKLTVITEIKKIETSKKVLGTVLIFCMLGITASMVGWFRGLEGADRIAGVFAGMIAIEVSFYAWKSKSENIMKYGDAHPYKKEPSSENNNSFGDYTPQASDYTNDTNPETMG